MKVFILMCVAILNYSSIFSQSFDDEPNYPQVGVKSPHFILTDVQHYEKKQVMPEDFKGKWLVLDMWNRYCGTCIKSFPETDSLQKVFAKDVAFMLVGYTGSMYSGSPDDLPIRELFGRLAVKNKLNLPIAYDSTLFRRFDVGPCPFIVLIDPDGIIRAITYKLTASDLTDFITGRTPKVPKITTYSAILEANLIEETLKKKQ